jgi:hypothetical protein
MSNRFYAAMARRTDAELVALLAEPPENWEAQALDAARAELASRNLTVASTTELARVAVRATVQAVAPLSASMKAIAFVGGVTLMPGLAILYLYSQYEKRGERTKARAIVGWWARGVGALFTLILALILLDRDR